MCAAYTGAHSAKDANECGKWEDDFSKVCLEKSCWCLGDVESVWSVLGVWNINWRHLTMFRIRSNHPVNIFIECPE